MSGPPLAPSLGVKDVGLSGSGDSPSPESPLEIHKQGLQERVSTVGTHKLRKANAEGRIWTRGLQEKAGRVEYLFGLLGREGDTWGVRN